MADFTLQDNQQVVLTANSDDSAGVAVTDPSALTWSVSDPSILAITGNGNTATVTPASPVKLGTATVTVTDGTLTASLVVDLVGSSPTSLVITPGTASAIGTAPVAATAA